jgi:hypothetical protein
MYLIDSIWRNKKMHQFALPIFIVSASTLLAARSTNHTATQQHCHASNTAGARAVF